MEHLSESTIKNATLQFMKTYYKFRPRTDETKVSFDKTTQSGLLVDGYLEFQQPNGKLFVATFEATSAATIGEVRYTLNAKLLAMDALKWSCFIVGGSLIAILLAGWWFFPMTNWLLNMLFFTVCILAGYFVAKQLLRQHSKYRYIYAVEQFKQYDADEQWIAIGDDVFLEPSDVYLQELKKQCTTNGFGLVVVNEAGQLHLDITPSRQDVFLKKRKAVAFINRVPNLRPIDLERFKVPYRRQMAICLAIFVLAGGVFYTQYNKNKPVVEAQVGYETNLTKRAESATPETNDYVVHPPEEVAPDPNPKPYNAASTNKVSAPMSAEIVTKPTRSSGKVMMYMAGQATSEGYDTYYDCERNNAKISYIVQDGRTIYPTFEAAKARMLYLKSRYGFMVNCMHTGCDKRETQIGYIVFFGFIHTEDSTANAAGIKINNMLKENKENTHIMVRQLIK